MLFGVQRLFIYVTAVVNRFVYNKEITIIKLLRSPKLSNFKTNNHLSHCGYDGSTGVRKLNIGGALRFVFEMES